MRTIFLAITSILVAAMCMTGHATTYYADAARPDDAGDGISWATAKQTIQAAVDRAIVGDTVLVNDGVYSTGGKITPGSTASTTSRVVVVKAITVRSVNGSQKTVIQGWGPNGQCGTGAVRGVYLATGATLVGFTITNGFTQSYGDGDYLLWNYLDLSGGGVFLTNGAVVSNCALIGNSGCYGGGAYLHYGGTLQNCTLSGNISSYGDGGGAYCYRGGILQNCVLNGNNGATYGGGAYCYYGGTLVNCTLSSNGALYYGGGVYCNRRGTLQNCVLNGNNASYGGGVFCYYGGTVINCTISGNRASYGDSGGVYGYNGCAFTNSIIYFNNPHDAYLSGSNNWFTHTCCANELPHVNDNMTANPLFVSLSTLRLQVTSPCRNTGLDADYLLDCTDLAGTQRVMGTHVDMGAYEYAEPSAPFIIDDVFPNAIVNTPFEYRITTHYPATGYTALSLPAGLSIAQATGVISGTPTTVGSNTVWLYAYNSVGTSGASRVASVYEAVIPLVVSLKETIKSSIKTEREEGESSSYEVEKGRGTLSVRGTIPNGLELATIDNDEQLTLTYGNIAVQLPFVKAKRTASSARWMVPSSFKDNGKPATYLAATLACKKGRFKLAVKTCGTDWLALAGAYKGIPTPMIRVAVEVTLGIGLRVKGTGALLIEGTSVVVARHVGGADGDDYELPKVTLKPAKKGPPGPVIISSASVACGVAGSPFSYHIVATGNPTSYTAKGRPDWLALNAGDGSLSGIPKAAGVHKIELNAAGRDGKGTAQLLLIVLDATPLQSAFAKLKLKETYAEKLKRFSEPGSDGEPGESWYETIICGATRMTMEGAWNKSPELDFTVLADEQVQLSVGELNLTFALNEAKLSATKATWLEGTSKTKVVLQQKKGALRISLTTRNPDNQVAASGFAGQDEPSLNESVEVTVQVGRALLLQGNITITGTSAVKERTMRGDEGETYSMPSVSIKGVLASDGNP